MAVPSPRLRDQIPHLTVTYLERACWLQEGQNLRRRKRQKCGALGLGEESKRLAVVESYPPLLGLLGVF